MNLQGSWKTTLLGVLALLGALVQVTTALLDNDPETKPNFEILATAAAGIGLIFARDNNKTSEDVGAVSTPKP